MTQNPFPLERGESSLAGPSSKSISLLLALLLVFSLLPPAFAAGESEEGPETEPVPETGLDKVFFWRADKSDLPQNVWTDLEKRADWERMAACYKRSGDWARDLLMIAQSQLGYRESKLNRRPDSRGVLQGYTRYGAWYGHPHGEWCAMFVSFCLYYAGVPKDVLSYESNCSQWIKQLKRRSLYASRDDAEPKPGDLIFLGFADEARHVGIVKAFDSEANEVVYLQGNDDGAVTVGRIAGDNANILGYGSMPANPALSAETPEQRFARALEIFRAPRSEEPEETE